MTALEIQCQVRRDREHSPETTLEDTGRVDLHRKAGFSRTTRTNIGNFHNGYFIYTVFSYIIAYLKGDVFEASPVLLYKSKHSVFSVLGSGQ